MNVAVLTLTRDRLDYTKHCFRTLLTNAGCEFDHYILDQGSTDGTREWLGGYDGRVVQMDGNVGISRGMNLLLSTVYLDAYDVIVKFDNDCELTMPNTLRDVCELARESRWLLSPRILGLRNPPAATRELGYGGETILDVPQIGGIFLAAHATVYREHGFRYSPGNPVFGGDDTEICRWWRQQGGSCGYVARLTANHYETTDGQHARYPGYFAQKRAEGCPV